MKNTKSSKGSIVFHLNWNDERGEADGVYLDDHSYK
jgi:hypothetical protein